MAFLAVLLMILGGIAAAVWWFGERSYFVGLQGNQVAIFKGRPGGLLWIQPSLNQRTNLSGPNPNRGTSAMGGIRRAAPSARDLLRLR